MALPWGKLTILVGAGIAGSIFVKEGRMPGVSDVISGAIKAALKPLKQSDSTSSTTKPRNDALMAQVNSLRQELQLIASNRPMTIVTSNTTGGRRYVLIIVIVAIGYGYVWWKGWRIPDFMFATRRGLADACNSVAKNLDEVFNSLRVTRNEISSKIDDSSDKYDDIVASSSTTMEEVTGVREKVKGFTLDIGTVNETIQTLERRMGVIQGRQDNTNEGVKQMLLSTLDFENILINGSQDSPSSASSPAIEPQLIAASSRTVSLPSTLEPSSPSTSYETNEINGSTRNTTSASDQRYQGFSGVIENNSSPRVSNGNRVTEITEKPPSPVLPATQTTAKSAGLLNRTISATRYFKW